MRQVKKEKAKSYILIGLILTSIIQVGILWNYQNHRLPTSFFAKIFRRIDNADFVTAKSAQEEYFRPLRLTISNGQRSQNSHWIILEEEDTYNKLWKGAKEYLKLALTGKQPVGSEIWSVEEKWDELIIKKGMLIEFKSNLKLSLIKWFLGVGNEAETEPDGIYKVMIIPGDGAVDKSSSVYIMDDENVYKYTIANSNQELIGASFDKLLLQIKEDKRYETRGYWVMKNVDPEGNLPFTYSPDILCVVQNPRFRQYKTISSSIPAKIYGANIDDIADIVLGSERYSYGSHIDFNDTIIYRNQDNIYRIYKNGLLEYRSVTSQNKTGGDNISGAFMNAYRFISRINKNFINGADIYLSGMIEHEGRGTYEFYFDYKLGEIPVMIDFNGEKLGIKNSNSAIIIEANNKQVLYCKWLLKKFIKEGREYKYMASIENVVDKLLGYSDLNVNDIYAAYVIGTDEEVGIEPSLVVEQSEGSNFTISMNR